MTQEQYNRYMDGLILKVASKRPLGKVASFVRKHASDAEREQVANNIVTLGNLYGSDMARQARNVPLNDNGATGDSVSQINEDADKRELQHKAQIASNAVDAYDRFKAMTNETVKKINDSNEAIHRKEMKTPETPSWYSKAYEWVKANPKTSLAIGGGAIAGGLLLAYLMRKKEKDAKKQKAVRKHKFIAGNPSLAFA